MSLETFIKLYSVRKIGTFLPKEYNLDKNFIKYMIKEGNIEYNGGGCYSVTESCQNFLSAFKKSLDKMDKEGAKL